MDAPLTLTDFLTGLAPDLRSDPVGTIRAACDLGLGHWLRPDQPCALAEAAMRRPATHLHEITLLGVTATGDTERAAAAHWLTVARRLTEAETEGWAA